MRPRVVVLSEAETVLGRTQPATGPGVQLPEIGIARRHAQVTYAEGTYWIEDLRSRNGTWLNHVRVTERTPLTDGDEIRVCDFDLYFCSGDPSRMVTVPAEWLTSTVTSLAGQMYQSCDLSAMPILADALQDAGCEDDRLLGHCRCHAPHVRGCWALDRILGKG